LKFDLVEGAEVWHPDVTLVSKTYSEAFNCQLPISRIRNHDIKPF